MRKAFRQGVVAAAAVVAGLSVGVIGVAVAPDATIAVADPIPDPSPGELGTVHGTANLIYNGQNQTLSGLTVKDKLGNVIPSSEYDFVYMRGGSSVTPKNAGTYTVKAVAKSSSSVASGATLPSEFKILPKPATIAARSATIYKGKPLPSTEHGTLSAQITGAATGDNLAYTFSFQDKNGTEITNSSKVGTYTIKIVLSEGSNPNYTITTRDSTLTIVDANSPFVDTPSGTPHREDIIWMSEYEISTGWTTGNGKEYRPYALVNRQDMAEFLYRLAGAPALTGVNAITPQTKSMFFDVDANTPHANAIWWCAQHQITTGWQDGPKRRFHGELPVARQDMAAFMHRLALHGVSPATPGKAGDADFFFDVTGKTPHANDIAWLAGNGIAKGWESPRGGYEFRGSEPVTRADMAAFIHRLYDKVISKPVSTPSTPSAT